MIGPTRTPRLVARAHDGAWRPLPPLPATRLLLFTPSLAALGGTGFPFGLPAGLTPVFPLRVEDQEVAEAWQHSCHERLEQSCGESIDGYVSLSLDRPQGQLPLVLQEAPETVGGKVWRGAWLLWKSLLHFEGALPSGRRVLEVGAGVGLVGLLLAADHGMKVTLSETRDGYSGAATTFENLRRNVERFHERRLARAAQADGADGVGAVEFGEAQVMELDWTQGVPVPEHSFDLVIGSDVLYEPHLFEDLLDVLQTAAPKAVLVQNLARKGTAYFLELCRQRNIEVKSEDVSHLDDDLPQTDAQDGVYHCWFLDFSQALPPDPGKSRWPEVAA